MGKTARQQMARIEDSATGGNPPAVSVNDGQTGEENKHKAVVSEDNKQDTGRSDQPTLSERALAASGNSTPAVIGRGVAPSWMDEHEAEDAGRGVSESPEDNIIPMMKVLHSACPECKEGDPMHIAGAEPGMILLRGAPVELHAPSKGVPVQAIAYYRKWVRWVPLKKGGGFVGAYDIPLGAKAEDHLPPGARKKMRDPDDDDNRDSYVIEGDELVDTRYFVGRFFVDGAWCGFISPFKSTAHKSAREWMDQIRNLRYKSGKPRPIFAGIFRMTTRVRTSEVYGEWWLPVLKFDRYATQEEYDAGKVLADAFASGEKIAATPEAEGVGSGDEGYDERV